MRLRAILLLVFLTSFVACGGGGDEESIPPPERSEERPTRAASSLEFPEGLDEATFEELIAEFHAFREPKFAVCPKDPAAVDDEKELERFPVVAELRSRRMIEEEDPDAESQEVRLTLSALSQLFGFTEDEDAYYLPIAARELVSIDDVDVEESNAVVRFKWKYVPHEIGTRILRSDVMTAEAKLVDEGDRWRVYDCKGLHPHLYNEHDRIATNRAELTYE